MAMEIKEYIEAADRIERDLSEAVVSIFADAVAELTALQARIESGEFDVK